MPKMVPTGVPTTVGWIGLAADVADASGVDDATYIASPLSPTSASYWDCALSAVTDPQTDEGLVLRFRPVLNASGGDSKQVTVRIYRASDDSTIKSVLSQVLYPTGEVAVGLTPTEAAQIVSYADGAVRVRVTAQSGAKALIQAGDFTYLGAFKVDDQATGFGWDPVGFAIRWVGGQRRGAMLNANHSNNTFEIKEFTIPTLVTSGNFATGEGINAALLAHSYSTAVPRPDGGWALWGLHWDETESRYYMPDDSEYDSAGVQAVFQWMNVSGTNLSWGGRVSFSDIPYKQLLGGVTVIPREFADAYTGGKRLGVGFGGYRSVMQSGSVSVGPALYAIDPPPDGLADGAVVSDGTCLMKAPTSDQTKYMVRPPWAGTCNNWYGVAPYGSPTRINWNFYIRQNITWIDTPTKHGVLLAASFDGGLTNTTITNVSGTSVTVANASDLHVGEYAWLNTVDGNDGWCGNIASLVGSTVQFTTSWGSHTPIVGGFFRTGGFYTPSSVGRSLAYSRWDAHGFLVYDPVTLALSAQGSLDPLDVTYARSWSVSLPHQALPQYSGYPGFGQAHPSAVVFDPTDARLYVAWNSAYRPPGSLANWPIVYVYQVN